MFPFSHFPTAAEDGVFYTCEYFLNFFFDFISANLMDLMNIVLKMRKIMNHFYIDGENILCSNVSWEGWTLLNRHLIEKILSCRCRVQLAYRGAEDDWVVVFTMSRMLYNYQVINTIDTKRLDQFVMIVD